MVIILPIIKDSDNSNPNGNVEMSFDSHNVWLKIGEREVAVSRDDMVLFLKMLRKESDD